VKAYLAGEGRIAKRFNIPSDSTVRKWVKAYQVFGEEALNESSKIKLTLFNSS